MARIFVVEDNEGLRKTVSAYLRLEEHDVVEFGRLAGLEEAVRMQQPELIILDVMLPDGDAFPFARRLRARSPVPIIFLTARTTESDRITGFEVGGDDYVVKPFSNKELMLRVRALLWRSTLAVSPETPALRRWELTLNGRSHVLEVDEEAHRCLHDGREVTLTAAEWKILGHLAGNARIVISRDRLLGVCLDYLAEGSERTIDTHVKNIRMKLDRVSWIDTVRGYGYRFVGREAEKGTAGSRTRDADLDSPGASPRSTERPAPDGNRATGGVPGARKPYHE